LTRGLGACLCAAFLLLGAAAATSASASVYFGALISGETYGGSGVAPNNTGAWDRFEHDAGKRVAILDENQGWCEFDKGEVEATAARGAIPLVTMGLKEGVTLESIVSGAQDAAIKKWAQEAKAWGHPFLFVPWWEMNGAWYSWGRNPQFVAAWRRFHDLVVGQGATNVTWTWVPNAIWYDPNSDPTPYYPGDAYVDWVGMDSYNWGLNPAQSDRWITPDKTISPTLEIIRKLAPSKPVAIVETASTEYGGNKTDWIREMLTTYLPHHPEIKAYLWFNWNFPKNGARADWPIESSAPAQQQFRQAVQSGFFVPAPVSLPTLTKVPPPAAGPADSVQAADLSDPAEVPAAPEVAVAPDGTATVVWSARAGGSFTVYMRRIEADSLGPVTALSAPGQDAFAPQVGVAPDGTATVAWIRSDGSNFLVQARRIAPDGTPAEATKNLSRSGQDAAAPRLDVGSEGTTTVVWKRFDGWNWLVEERRLTPAGERLPAEATNVLSATGGDAVEPAVAAGLGGTATVVWSRYEGSHSVVQERRIGPAGSPEATTTDLSVEGQNAIAPQVAVAPAGAATAVWTRFDGSHWVIQERRLSAAGVAEGTPASLSGSFRDSAEPQLAVGADGRVTVVWDRYDGSNFIVQARRIDPAGALAPAALNLSAAGRDAGEPQVDIAPDGTATVLWSRFDGSDWVVQRRDLGPGEALSGITDLSAAGRRGSGPAVAWGSGGDLTMAWRRFAGSGDVVEATPLPPPPPPAEEEGGSGAGGGGEQAPGPGATGGKKSAAPGSGATEAAASSLRLVKAIVNRKHGTARLLVEVSGPGHLALKGAVPRGRAVDAAGTVALKIVPRPVQRRALVRDGSVAVKVTVVFQPASGDALSRSLKVRLKTLG
jgi:hypothetical protein